MQGNINMSLPQYLSYSRDSNGNNLLHNAALNCDMAGLKILQLATSQRMPLDIKNDEGKTALQLAISSHFDYTDRSPSNQESIIELLIMGGADVNATDRTGNTPLLAACLNSFPGRANIVDLLITKQANVEVVDEESQSALMAACLSVDNDSVRILGNLISNGADVNKEDDTGYTPLLVACKNLQKYSFDAIDLIIEKGAKVIAADSTGETPLLAVCHSEGPDRVKIIQLLLARGAQVNVPDNLWETPLIAACLTADKQRAEIIALLVANGANVNAQDRDLESPLMVACRNIADGQRFSIIEYLICKNAITKTVNSEEDSPLHIICQEADDDGMKIAQLLIERGGNVNALNRSRQTPLHLIGTKASKEMVELLIQNNANLETCDIQGNTPLHTISETFVGKADISDDSAFGIINICIAAGAKINAINKASETALHLAVRGGHKGTAIALLEAEIDCNMKDCYGNIALAYADDHIHTYMLLVFGSNPNITNNRGLKPAELVLSVDSSEYASVRDICTLLKSFSKWEQAQINNLFTSLVSSN